MALNDQCVWPAQPLPATVSGFMQRISSQAEVGQALDFTMDYVAKLCINEPENCAFLLDTLVGRGEDMQDNMVVKGDDFHQNKVSLHSEAYTGPVSNDYQLIDNRKEQEVKKIPFLGIPRHFLMLALIPFFPVMLLFTASGGLAFFVTAGIEFVAR